MTLRGPVIGVIGPSNPVRVGEAAGIPADRYLGAASRVGQIIAETALSMIVVPDRGVAIAAMDAYLANGGDQLVAICPRSGVSEGPANDNIERNRDRCHVIVDDVTWYEQHHEIGRRADALVCIGLSCGTMAEIAWTKWNPGPPIAAIGGTFSVMPSELIAEVMLDVIELDGVHDWLTERLSTDLATAGVNS